ncbi:MAG: hypothetical protein U5K00_23960 [Melioribacteraceae bacterium]|nr:hypothetical protein [Melioribacteraceae bacterium]
MLYFSFIKKGAGLTALLLFILMASEVRGQDVKVDGSLKINNDFYNASGIENRRESFTSRGILRLNLTLFDQINLPFEFMLSTQDSEFRQPFNQFGVSPQISDWLTLHGGYFNTEISQLTYGDTRLLGGGFELTPGDFQLKVLYGRSKKQTTPDSSFGRLGVRSQYMYSASIGYGDQEASFISLNLLHAVDDTNSIENDSLYFKPEENLTASISFGIKPSDVINFNAEVAVSALSNDINSDKLDDAPNIPSFFFTPRTSTQIDGAVIANLNIKPSNTWDFRINSKWIGPGFVSLGYAQLANDVFEITGQPTVKLLDNRLRLRGKAGIRFNNLRDQKLATTNRFTGGLNVDWQINQVFGFNTQFNNNQIVSKHDRDSIRSNYRLNNLVISPRFSFTWLEAQNNINISYNYTNSQNENPLQQNNNKNITNSINLTHSIFLPSQWNFSTNFFYSNADLSQSVTDIYNISETVGKSFLQSKLRLSVTLGYSSTSVQDISNDRLLTRFRASYNTGSYGQIVFNFSNNNFTNDQLNSPDYNELQASLDYKINF